MIEVKALNINWVLLKCKS